MRSLDKFSKSRSPDDEGAYIAWDDSAGHGNSA